MAIPELSWRNVTPKVAVSPSFLKPWHRRTPFTDVVTRGVEIVREVRGEGMRTVRLLASTWDALGRRDALASILTRSDDRGWTVEEFFETGRADVARLMANIERLAPSLERRRTLDFGCGVGRLAKALSPHFQTVIGIDISESMIAQARGYNRAPGRCHFDVNLKPHLRRFAGNTFDFVWSRLVLQHTPQDSCDAISGNFCGCPRWTPKTGH